MASALPRPLLEIAYEEAAQAYLRSLPPEHFMEAVEQGNQRKVTLESLDLVSADRPEVQVFNELLVQYAVRGQRQPRQVVPDNMVVICKQRIRARTSFNVPLEPVGPFWMLEYVSKSNKRKDYEDNFEKYERDLKVPYYLLFYPDTQDLTLYRHTTRKYAAVPPNAADRYPLPELDLEMGLIDGWVRFWYRGELMPLPADLQRDLDEKKREVKRAKRRARRAEQRADEVQRLADELQRLAEQEKLRADQEAVARKAAERELRQLRAQLTDLEKHTRNES